MLVISAFKTGLTLLAVPAWWMTFGSGALLLFALAFDHFASFRRNKS